MCTVKAFLDVVCFAKDLKYNFYFILNLKLLKRLFAFDSKTMTKNIEVRG